ncbi:hypothetical protein DPMN_161260 [Dreissena polymorpha]|uniref:Uncharacterized protein n=1 Tax=Dreissena polymorpha TaxID=45954 RepID=A0A9D4EMD7_DREPO|nr:hypothetical protein DPMN_161260 [Dreissena polymorpha]
MSKAIYPLFFEGGHKKVLQDIHESMVMEEKSKNTIKKRKNCVPEPEVQNKKQKLSTFEPVDIQNINEYVVVAYQDGWYPGCVENITASSDTVTVKFLSPSTKPGFFQWPSREDRQIVHKQFVIYRNFVPDCVCSGRQWFIKEHDNIDAIYNNFHATFFC